MEYVLKENARTCVIPTGYLLPSEITSFVFTLCPSYCVKTYANDSFVSMAIRN